MPRENAVSLKGAGSSTEDSLKAGGYPGTRTSLTRCAWENARVFGRVTAVVRKKDGNLVGLDLAGWASTENEGRMKACSGGLRPGMPAAQQR